MLLRPDDEVYRVDAVWLGPPVDVAVDGQALRIWDLAHGVPVLRLEDRASGAQATFVNVHNPADTRPVRASAPLAQSSCGP